MNKIVTSVLISLSVVKRISLYKTYLNTIPLLIGIRELFIGKINILFLVLASFPLYSALLFSIGKTPFMSFARSIQFLLLVFFGNWLIRIWNFDVRKNVNWIVIILSMNSILIDHYNGIYLIDRTNFDLLRFHLIVGEPNFSSLLYVVLFSFTLLDNRKLEAVLFASFVLISQSRMGILGILCALFLFVFKNSKSKLRWLNVAINTLFFTYPAILILIDRIANDPFKQTMVHKLSPRFYLHVGYIEMFFKNLLGVGYFNGINRIESLLSEKAIYLKESLKVDDFEIAQQHSLQIQLISEFGLIGIAVLIYLCYTANKIIKNDPRKLIVWGPFILSTLLINCMHEVSLFIVFAYLVKDSFLENKDLNYKTIIYEKIIKRMKK
ncbi:MAG: hypothetical protein HN576_13460 [Bacteriovoracaceae bacterium]|jgi:hypothetical protein|nr:hypothetical protein [Bacteriovoracaceae bacterium]